MYVCVCAYVCFCMCVCVCIVYVCVYVCVCVGARRRKISARREIPHNTHGSKRFGRVERIKGIENTNVLTPPALVRVAGESTGDL
jgi:hypothetical protein